MSTLTPQSIDQLLSVFQRFRVRRERGEPLRSAYQDAVREIAQQGRVTYQTIGDLCRRRLSLATVNETCTLLDKWMDGDPYPLKNQVKKCSAPSTHDAIDEFFGTADWPALDGRTIAVAATGETSERFSVELDGQAARKLRALALLEGVSPEEVLSRLVGPAATEMIRMRLT